MRTYLHQQIAKFSSVGQWKKDTWTKIIRNAGRRVAAESLLEVTAVWIKHVEEESLISPPTSMTVVHDFLFFAAVSV